MMASILAGLSDLNWILVGAVMVSWMATAFALMSLRQTRLQEQKTQALLASLQHDLMANSHGLVGMGKKLLTIEKAIKPKTDKPLRQTAPKTADNVVSLSDKQEKRYRQARLMLGQGLSVEQVANASGISLAEASLIAMLREPRQAMV
ncbi:DUF2802 domain-containing protein [Simiduia agarivorans]|uniref:DUF2802 domain-containing protein n=1 Tax=Simiduia agarivorans (strain DSM 21679 / JCM 13881 / BCRC 17597 / SA1) TaxID=1117647 RepID=K4KFL3_SIMAS|nr:DUF2802 domain-containing protein [Simiduia agarivorans]AFU97716.1 hypothetical protein M5M_02485 [Simiduia agarivorans SA1 = DSM 21679]